jgi:hypothetical protein
VCKRVGDPCEIGQGIGRNMFHEARIRALTGTPTPDGPIVTVVSRTRPPEPTPMAVPLRLRADEKLVNGIGAMIKRTRGYSFTINSTEIGLILDTVEAFLAERDRASRPPGGES